MSKEAQRKRLERARKREAGLIPVELWIYPEHKALMKRLEMASRGGCFNKVYLEEAFNMDIESIEVKETRTVKGAMNENR